MYQNKYFCDPRFTDYIEGKYGDELSALDPAARAARRFLRMCQELPIHFETGDFICGHFGYEEIPAAKHVTFAPVAALSEAVERKKERLRTKYNTVVAFDRGHVTVDYETILRRGLRHYAREISRSAQENGENGMLVAMAQALDAVKQLTERMAAAAAEAATAASGEERDRLLCIAEMATRLPFEPAKSFLDALQSVWLIHFLVPMSTNAYYSISLGRFDRYMLPYYEKAIADGVSPDRLKAYLYNFWCLLNSYADGACALNVGGGDKPEEEYNALSELVIACQKEFAMCGPILAARITPNTPRQVLRNLIDIRLFSRGQPTFYFEHNCRRALIEKGLPEGAVENFAVQRCMAFGVAGDELNSMWGCVLEMTKIFESAVASALTGDNPVDMAGLLACFEAEAETVFRDAAEVYEATAALEAVNAPDVFVSALTESAIAKGVDRVSGVTYHNVTVECMGLANVADGMGAIGQLVYAEGKYTLRELFDAVRSNFAAAPGIRADLLAAPKYGRNDPKADGVFAGLMERMQKIIRARDHDTIYYQPSLHTLAVNVDHGLVCGAGFDGRLAGEPLAKNAGPGNFARTHSPTSVILSAGCLPQTAFYGGQPIDIHFTADSVRNHPDAIATAIRVYGQCGGLQLQVNSASARELREAVKNPAAYADLIVRIGGYSCYFNTLSEAAKLEFIERFEKEE